MHNYLIKYVHNAGCTFYYSIGYDKLDMTNFAVEAIFPEHIRTTIDIKYHLTHYLSSSLVNQSHNSVGKAESAGNI